MATRQLSGSSIRWTAHGFAGMLGNAFYLPRMALAEYLSNDDLTTIRQNTDWRHLFLSLGIAKDPKKSKDHDWWGKSPFNPTERTASFHINDKGWYCQSTDQGGGVIELLQRLHPEFSCYDAGRWLLEHGVSHVVATARTEVRQSLAEKVAAEEPPSENRPIRQDLRLLLQPEHPLFEERGIPPPVLEKLGAGYLERPPRKDGRPDPINRRLVFQIRREEEASSGALESVVLSHTGRATTTEQAETDGKWWTYGGFRKSLELYHLDRVLLDGEARRQSQATGHVIVVEGCFDVAKLVAAGIENAVATFGAHLSETQIPRFDLLVQELGVERFLICYDRDQDGVSLHGLGAAHAQELLTAHGFEVEMFDWQREFQSSARETVSIPETITDPCEFSIPQLQWLRKNCWL